MEELEKTLRLFIHDWYFLSSDEIDQIVEYACNSASEDSLDLVPIELISYFNFQTVIYSPLFIQENLWVITLLAIVAYVKTNGNPPYFMDKFLEEYNIAKLIQNV